MAVGDRTDIDRRTLGKMGALGAATLLLPAGTRPTMAGFAEPRVEWRTDPVGIDTRSPRFRWTLQAPARQRDVRQTAFRLQVVGGVGSGRPGALLFDSGWRASDATHFAVDDLPLRSQAAYAWRLAVATDGRRGATPVYAGRFVTGLIDPEAWHARWISDGADLPPRGPTQEWQHWPETTPARMPLLRARFDEPRPAVAAFLSIAGLGQYALSIDGQPVADGTMRPAWSDYRKRILYDSFDVTRLIRPGSTVIGVMLGNGFFNVEHVTGRYTKFVGSFGRPKLIAQLRLIFADGSERIVASGADWLAAPGPVIRSSIYGGEDEDARLMPPGWDTEAHAPAAFVPATRVATPGGRLTACGIGALAVMEGYVTPRFSQPRPGVLIADFGKNFAGRPAVTFTGLAAGQAVTMTPGELLHADGTVDQTSMTGHDGDDARIVFTYTGSGPASQRFRPRFTYTGFRFLQIEGAARERITALTGEFLHLDTPRTGHFRCSDPRLEAIHALIEQAVRSNLASIVTDCPHREKLGWLEQIYLNASTIFYNRDAIALYEKMIADIRAAQLPSGMVPAIAPEFIAFTNPDGTSTMFRDTPEWGCAIVLAPWEAYRFHGDPAILRDTWPAMRAYARHLAARAVGGILDFGLGDWYDIGPDRPGVAQLTSRAFTGTATWYAVLTTIARVGDVLGDSATAQTCRSDAARVRDTINHRFLDSATGRYDRGSQTAQAMALTLGIVPPALVPAARDLLIAAIRVHDDHVTAGDIGFHYVVRALTEAQRPDVLQAMLTRSDAPSYGDQLAHGATALTEAWNADPRSSQNHFMLGHIERWFYGGLGGLCMAFGEDGPPIVVAPQLAPGLAWVDVGYDSVCGPIRSQWQRVGEGCRMTVTIPAGATARLLLPTPPADVVSGIAPGMIAATADGTGTGTALHVGSGVHVFDLRRVAVQPASAPPV